MSGDCRAFGRRREQVGGLVAREAALVDAAMPLDRLTQPILVVLLEAAHADSTLGEERPRHLTCSLFKLGQLAPTQDPEWRVGTDRAHLPRACVPIRGR